MQLIFVYQVSNRRKEVMILFRTNVKFAFSKYFRFFHKKLVAQPEIEFEDCEIIWNSSLSSPAQNPCFTAICIWHQSNRQLSYFPLQT